jgi:hypothetical protein
MSMHIFVLRLRHLHLQCAIKIYEGIHIAEVCDVISAAFPNLEGKPVGISENK